VVTLSAAGGVSCLSSSMHHAEPLIVKGKDVHLRLPSYLTIRQTLLTNLRCGRGDPLFNATLLVAPSCLIKFRLWLLVDWIQVIRIDHYCATFWGLPFRFTVPQDAVDALVV
jgi:hypothetical protein